MALQRKVGFTLTQETWSENSVAWNRVICQSHDLGLLCMVHSLYGGEVQILTNPKIPLRANRLGGFCSIFPKNS